MENEMFKISAQITKGNDLASIAMVFNAKSRSDAFEQFRVAMRQLGFGSIDYVDVVTRKIANA